MRPIKTPKDIEPVHLQEFEIYHGREDEAIRAGVPALWVSAEGAARAAKVYGELCRETRKVYNIVKESEHGSKRQRRYYRLFMRCVRARDAWETLFNGWIESFEASKGEG